MPRRDEPAGLEGVLVLAKPPGPTSHDVVALARRLTGTRRIGHGGTLDPFAAGVLPLFLGGATRLVEYHLGDRKGYRATICFGASSTTDDLDGELTPVPGPALESAAVEAALGAFRGEIRQRPPAYSAIQVGGRRAYAMAREGTPAELAERTVTIHELELVAWNSDDPARPIAIVDVSCSAGTYIRAIARDLGAALGSAAYLGALSRTASGPFRLADAVSLDTLRAAATEGEGALKALLLPVDAGLEDMPAVHLAPEEIADAAMGRFVRPAAGLSSAAPGVPIRLLDATGTLVGIGAVDGKRIAPAKMLPAAVADAAARREAVKDASASPSRPMPEDRTGGMVVVPGIDALTPDLGRLFIVVGVFDGLHLGHRYLLEHLVAGARRRAARPAVVTFDSHPDEVITGKAPPLLCDAAERLERLEAAAVEVTVVQHFDAALRMNTYEQFIRRIAAGTPIAGFLMTPDSAFGNERRGTPDAVAELGTEMGYDVDIVPALDLDGRPVRSGEIRSAIGAGDLAGAALLLGRPYGVVGEGRSGNQGAVELSFPMPVALPPPGEYSVTIERLSGSDGILTDGGQANGEGRPALAQVRPGGRLTVAQWTVGAGGSIGGRLRVLFQAEHGVDRQTTTPA